MLGGPMKTEEAKSMDYGTDARGIASRGAGSCAAGEGAGGASRGSTVGASGATPSQSQEATTTPKNELKDFTKKVYDGLGNLKGNAPTVSGMAMLEKVSHVTGDQLLAKFLKISFSSARTRREVGSAAASEVAQALLVKHSKPVIEPILEDVRKLGHRVAMQVASATTDVLLDYVHRLLSTVQRAALWTVASSDELIAAVTSPLTSKLRVSASRWEVVALRATSLLLVFTSLRALYLFTSQGFRIGIACGGLVGLVSTASYWRHRYLRAQRSYVLSSEWLEGGRGDDCLTYFKTASEDTVGTDGRLVHHGLIWLNTLLTIVWPKLAKYLGNFLQATVNDLVAHFKPSFVSSLEIVACDLGNLPIDVRRMLMNHTTDSEIDFDVAILWNGQVSIDLVIEVQGARFFTQIRHLHFKGEFHVKAAPLVPVFPGFAGVAVSLIKPPELDFKVSVKQVFTPGVVVTWLKRFILETIDDLLLWPNRIVVPLLDEEQPNVGRYMHRLLCHAVGIIRVAVVAAEGLDKADLRGSDPYVLVDTSRSEFKITKTIRGTQSPVWEEVCYLQVFEVSRALHIELWDEDNASADDLLGRCCIDISGLKPGRPYDRWYNLGMGPFHSIEGCGAGFGKIRLRTTWWPMEEMLAKTGINVVDTKAVEYKPEQLSVVQRGCVFAQAVRCSELPLDSSEDEYVVQVSSGSERYTSIGGYVDKGTVDLCFSAQFYDVCVTGEVVFKVLRRSKPGAALSLVGVLAVPLAFPAVSPDGVLEGTYKLASLRRHSVAIKLQWLPLDCASLPFPPVSPTTHGCLGVFVEKATSLINADVVGLSDPFVKLAVGTHKARSKCLQETLNPVWNEHFEFVDVSTRETLTVRVRDQDAATSESLGEVTLPVAEVARVCDANTAGYWYNTWPLRGVKSGAVSMRLHWNPGHRFTDTDISVARRSAQRALREQRVAELPRTTCRLQEALQLPHWHDLTGVVWQEPLERGQAEGSTTGGPSQAITHGLDMPKWSVLLVLHGIHAEGMDKSGGDSGARFSEPLAAGATPPGSTGRLPSSGSGDPARLQTSFSVRGLACTLLWAAGTDAVGLEWRSVPPAADDDLVVEIYSTTLQGDAVTGQLTVPLSAAWSAPERYLSGRFRVSGCVEAHVELELAWVCSRAAVSNARPLSTRTLNPVVTFSEVGALHVKLLSARGLRAADSNGSSDPFCVFKTGPYRFVSTVKFKTLGPTWDETFTFPNIAQSSVLHVKIYDKDKLRNDFLGEVHIPVQAVVSTGKGQLQSAFRLKGQKATGAVFLQLKWERSAGGSPMAPVTPLLKTIPRGVSVTPHSAASATGGQPSLSDRLGMLTVVLDAGRDLAAMDRDGSSDPFCTLKVADQRHVTSRKKKTLNPEWGERFVFENVSPEDCLRINVWDEDFMTKERMGTAVVAVGELTSASLQKHILPVTLNGSPAGRLLIHASWKEEDFSEEAKTIFMQSSTDFDASSPSRLSPFRAVAGEPLDDSVASSSPQTGDVSGVSERGRGSGEVGETAVGGGGGVHSPPRVSLSRALSWKDVKLLHCEWNGVTGLRPSRSARRVFMAFKVGHERHVTEVVTVGAECTEVTVKVAFRLPVVAADRSQRPFVLRARLYERLPMRQVKRMVAEAQVALDCVIQDERRRVMGKAWPMTGRSIWNAGHAAILLDLCAM